VKLTLPLSLLNRCSAADMGKARDKFQREPRLPVFHSQIRQDCFESNLRFALLHCPAETVIPFRVALLDFKEAAAERREKHINGFSVVHYYSHGYNAIVILGTLADRNAAFAVNYAS
jgi:hypothetical protein